MREIEEAYSNTNYSFYSKRPLKRSSPKRIISLSINLFSTVSVCLSYILISPACVFIVKTRTCTNIHIFH